MITDYLKRFKELRESGNPKPKGYAYSGVEDYVLTHAHLFESAEFTEAEADYAQHLFDLEEWEIKQCFSNSQQILLNYHVVNPQRGMKLRYIEGYATTGIIPFLHGWLSLNGKVLDPTLRHHLTGERTQGVIAPDFEYFGTEIDSVWILKRVRATKCWGSILDCYEMDYPLLRSA